jgi:cyclic beta-1,2-glucan synthetase
VSSTIINIKIVNDEIIMSKRTGFKLQNLFANLLIGLKINFKIYKLKKKLQKEIDEAGPKSLIKVNRYLLLKYFNNVSIIRTLIRKSIFGELIDLDRLELEKKLPIQTYRISNLRFTQIQLRICFRAIYLFEKMLDESDISGLEHLDELHRLNNKSYLFEIYKCSAEYLLLSKIDGFKRTDIFNILEILNCISIIPQCDLDSIQDWKTIQKFLGQKKYLRVASILLVITAFCLLILSFNRVNYFYFLIPTFILFSLNISKLLPISLIKTYQTIRYLPKMFDRSEVVAVLIPIIYNKNPDYEELNAQINNIENSEKYAKIEIYLLFDESDSKVDQLEDYWNSKLKEITENFQKINQNHSPINIWLRGYTYNKYDKIFMGYERKRGKIEEFIKWSRGESTKSKIYTNSNPTVYKYAFILDEGMDVSQNCISQLLGILVHPANSPVIENGRVVSGYAIAQPKSITKIKTKQTIFQYLFDKSGFINFSYGESGDLITDLTRKSNFNGKGLINLEVFSTLLFDAFPENLVLSHDLLEGSKCRTVTDHLSSIFEEYPENFFMYQKRENRWMRGDLNASLFILPKFVFNGKLVSFQTDIMDRVRIFLNLVNISRNICELIFIILFPNIVISLSLILLFRYSTSIVSVIKTLVYNLIYFNKISVRYTLHAIKNNFDLFQLFTILNLFNIYVISVSALILSIYRLISGKFLLEWSTYKQVANVKISFSVIDISIMILSSIIFFQFNLWNTSLIILLSLVVYLVNILLSRKFPEIKIPQLSVDQKNYIYDLISDTYNGVDKLLVDKSSGLPIDHASELGSFENTYTSITNIGFYMLRLCSVSKLEIIDNSTFKDKLVKIMDAL